MGTKKALIVGINYPNTPHELRGCINDANLISSILTERFGFKAKNKRMLTDESATTINIKQRLDWLVDGAQSGDVLVFHYSGHGSQAIDSKYDSDDEPDGLDEVLVPIDMNWRDKIITDDYLKQVFNKVPNGVNLTVILDCCHSGSALDQSHQYQSLGTARSVEFAPDSPNRARLLPMPADIANRGLGLNLQPRPRKVQTRRTDSTGVLISGCQSHQTSADAWIDNRFIGAATHALTETLRRHNYDVDYKQLIDEMNGFMVDHKFSQRPELNGIPSQFNASFLSPKKAESGGYNDPPSTLTIWDQFLAWMDKWF